MKPDPSPGDLIGCSDGDFGIVISTFCDYSDGLEDSLVVEVMWNSGKTLTDSWKSQDFSTSKNMFWIMSRA